MRGELRAPLEGPNYRSSSFQMHWHSGRPCCDRCVDAFWWCRITGARFLLVERVRCMEKNRTPCELYLLCPFSRLSRTHVLRQVSNFVFFLPLLASFSTREPETSMLINKSLFSLVWSQMGGLQGKCPLSIFQLKVLHTALRNHVLSDLPFTFIAIIYLRGSNFKKDFFPSQRQKKIQFFLKKIYIYI